jgi:hypothetical protein
MKHVLAVNLDSGELCYSSPQIANTQIFMINPQIAIPQIYTKNLQLCLKVVFVIFYVHLCIQALYATFVRGKRMYFCGLEEVLSPKIT